MTKSEAFLECRCGSCRITLCDPNMRYRCECLCCDCRQRGLISAGKRTENELPMEVAVYERGIDLVYFSNALLVDQKSWDLLEFFMLDENSDTRNAISSCCGTLMCSSHPLGEGCSTIVNADNCRVTVPNIIDTQSVLWGCDFPSDKYETRLKRDRIPKVFSPYDEVDAGPMIAFVTAISAPIAVQYRRDGVTTFEALCAGKKIFLDNSYFYESRMGKPGAAIN